MFTRTRLRTLTLRAWRLRRAGLSMSAAMVLAWRELKAVLSHIHAKAPEGPVHGREPFAIPSVRVMAQRASRAILDGLQLALRVVRGAWRGR